MTLLTLLAQNGIDTSVARDIRVSGLLLSSNARDIRLTAQAVTFVTRDIRLQGQLGSISYLGQLGTASSNASASSLSITTPAITAGTHVILLVSHSSGGNVTGATDTRGNIWTLDHPSTYNGSVGAAIVSAHIDNFIQSGDQITVN